MLAAEPVFAPLSPPQQHGGIVVGLTYRDWHKPWVQVKWMYRVRMNDEQVQTLASLRDTLLPKLLSGEIEVPEAEASVEEAIA